MAAAWTGDHLRVCGADLPVSLLLSNEAGSPPRVRSRLKEVLDAVDYLRITSACAEQTDWQKKLNNSMGDHLRVCGADYVGGGVEVPIHGSPPRVRSRQLYFTVF